MVTQNYRYPIDERISPKDKYTRMTEFEPKKTRDPNPKDYPILPTQITYTAADEISRRIVARTYIATLDDNGVSIEQIALLLTLPIKVVEQYLKEIAEPPIKKLLRKHRAQIIALRHERKTVSQIAHATGLSNSMTERLIKVLIAEGEIRQLRGRVANKR